MKLVAAVALAALFSTAAMATECPQGTTECKVLILNAQEQAILTQPNGVLDTAEKARFLDMSPVVRYFRDKIAAAPEGEVKKAEPASAPSTTPPAAPAPAK